MHDFSPIYTPLPAIALAFLPLIAVAALWSLAIKGYALWHAARNSQKWWYVALLVVNSVGILELIYLIWFRKPTSDTVSGASPKSEAAE